MGKDDSSLKLKTEEEIYDKDLQTSPQESILLGARWYSTALLVRP